MANVRTKKNQLPMTVSHRDFDNKYNWPGKYKAPLPPPSPDPVYPERPKSKEAVLISGLFGISFSVRG